MQRNLQKQSKSLPEYNRGQSNPKNEKALKEALSLSDEKSIKLRSVDFRFEETQLTETLCFPITEDIVLGQLLNEREKNIIYYEELEVSITYGFKTISNTQLGEMKFAILWIRNPNLLAEKDNFFCGYNTNGDQEINQPSLFLNPQYRGQILVLRDTWITSYVHKSVVDQSANIGDMETGFIRKKILFQLEKKNSTYYSDTNRNLPPFSEYDGSQQQRLTVGQLVILMMPIKDANTFCSFEINGRLKFR